MEIRVTINQLTLTG